MGDLVVRDRNAWALVRVRPLPKESGFAARTNIVLFCLSSESLPGDLELLVAAVTDGRAILCFF